MLCCSSSFRKVRLRYKSNDITRNPVVEPTLEEVPSHLENNCYLGGGTGLPFFSTDSTVALRGAELGADIILMLKWC